VDRMHVTLQPTKDKQLVSFECSVYKTLFCLIFRSLLSSYNFSQFARLAVVGYKP
jgi:hypothetical protein